MHIQQIEIDNFKSFSEKTVIPFEEGFTTISGPNGSGKSNIIDSVLFCLGLSSSRTMRAEKLTDLINNLSRRREATVTIMFGVSDSPDEEKVMVSRRIKDNGKAGYGSTYFLNGRVSTLTEIHDRLSQHNISPGAYNVLMQGDVTGIINMSPMERRKIIDEIAGVAEFDRKIDQAQKELGSVSASVERFSLLLEELNTRVTQLASEREQALKYQKLKDEKQQFEGMLLTAKLMDLKKAVQTAEQNIIDARKRKSATYTQFSQIEKQIAKTNEELTKIANEVKRKGEDQQIALKKQIEGLKGAISRKKDSIQFGQETRQQHARTIERAEEQIKVLEAKIEDLNGEVEIFQQREAEIQTKLKAEQELLEKAQGKLTALADATGELGKHREETRQALTTAQDQFSILNRQKLDTEANLERQQRERAYQAERLSVTSQRQQEILPRKEALEKTLKDADLEREAFNSQIQNQQLEVSKLRVGLNNATGELNQLSREYDKLEAQRRAYEDMNFGRAIDTILDARIPGVHGTLAQLGKVDDEYAVALEIAMGARLKNIVVDDDGVAQEGVQLLQRSNAGRATFLPMNKMREAGFLPLLPSDDGIIDYAYNLMDFDDEYRDVFAFALGDTVVVEDMATARKYQRKFRIVTLDGSLFEKSGAITGGSYKAQASGVLSAGKLDGPIKELYAKLEKKDTERDSLEKKLTSAELKLDALKEDYSKFLTEAQRNQLELENLEREWAQIAASNNTTGNADEVLAELDALIAQLTKQAADIEAQLVAKQAEIDQLTKSLEGIDAQLPTEQIEALNREINDINFQIRNYETQLNNAANDIKSKQLEKEFQEKGIQSHREQIVQMKANMETIEKEKVGLLEEIQLITTQIEALEAQAGEMDEELKRLQEERDKIQAQLIQEEREKYNLSQELTKIDEQILAFQARKKELQPEIEAVRNELVEAGVDPDNLPEEELPNAEEIVKNIQSIDRKMEAMGAVNMKAIQEYDEVMQRHTELKERIETLSREREALEIKISGYAELKLNAFMTAFENVDNNFREIFAELSDGEGHLVLTNTEDPFAGGLTIQARPRDKKMLRMESMSGGEKSLTALAFVFAFQRYMPAPFYAFDEVDMHLDGLNAEKLASMVKKQAGAAQFIVVSHRKPMLQNSDRTVGVTQKKDGLSKVTGVILRDEPA